MAKDENFHSRNMETGLLENIDEVRKVGIALVEMLQTLLLSPVLRLSLPPGLFLDMVTMAIQAETMLHTVSEADTLRLISGLLGKGPLDAEAQISRLGLSESLPVTHPDAVTHKIETTPVDPNDPLVRDSEMLQRAVERDKGKVKKEPHVPLPASLEDFLREALREDKPKGE